MLNKEYEDYIHLSRYARYLPEENRRETWEETVKRYCDFFDNQFGKHRKEVEAAIVRKDVMPSMRCLMTAGDALDRDHVAGYNCAYMAIRKPNRFAEAMYILMCGTGVGFSVEANEVSQLPEVPEFLFGTSTVIKVADSKIGWSKALKELISMLYLGHIPSWDLSGIRPSGSPLKTFGGRASGPEPLDRLFNFVVNTFKGAQGRKLLPIECHDIMCNIADAIVVGGVRRSALISLSDVGDIEMQRAKTGAWWDNQGYRALSNNSAVYGSKPALPLFMDEWVRMYNSRSGERGIFNRRAIKNKVAEFGKRDPDWDFGTNPCSEIILRDAQFCNLSEVIIRESDTEETLQEKVRIATIIGTVQATLTDFRFLGKEWSTNCKEERLLGVSLTGIFDNLTTYLGLSSLTNLLINLRKQANETNALHADRLGIARSAAITCVKPSGTVSQLCSTASGIHPRYSKYYIRNVRQDKKDPLTKWLIDQGMPYSPAPEKPEDMVVFSFPIASPKAAVTKDDITGLNQLEVWLTYAAYWCEHKPSMTCYYTDKDFLAIGAWVYDNFDYVSGIAFLPVTDNVYKLAPYEEITEEEYKEKLAAMPSIDLSTYREYTDNTSGSQELACTGDKCEI